ncbi:ABC transporter permease [Streptomyces roseolus]|uniref:ABC transporter permease n=1 Tax=Streptomyces roseolus TaxID=67358 RepID=UPI003793870F
MFNPDLKTSWVMVPALVGMIMAFIGTIITSIGLVRERQAGTLEQLAVMPFRASDVIVGKIAPYFALAALDMIIVTVVGCLVFGVPFAGSVAVLALGAALFLFTILGIGVLISSVSQNQGQAMQLALMTLLPQILLSGMIFPLAAMAAGVRWIGYLFPLTYFNMISNAVMLRDAPISSLALPLGVLACMAVLVFSFAVLRFRKDLAPSAPRSARKPAPAGAAR